MSDAARWMIAFAFISLPTIAFGGYFFGRSGLDYLQHHY